jgi:hypothetical protein
MGLGRCRHCNRRLQSRIKYLSRVARPTRQSITEPSHNSRHLSGICVVKTRVGSSQCRARKRLFRPSRLRRPRRRYGHRIRVRRRQPRLFRPNRRHLRSRWLFHWFLRTRWHRPWLLWLRNMRIARWIGISRLHRPGHKLLSTADFTHRLRQCSQLPFSQSGEAYRSTNSKALILTAPD